MFFWGDDRAGCDPVFVEQNGTNLSVAVSNCHVNKLHSLTTDIRHYRPNTWVKLALCYGGNSKELELYLDGKLIKREVSTIVPSVDRPMPLWLGGWGQDNANCRFRGKLRLIWLSNLPLPKK